MKPIFKTVAVLSILALLTRAMGFVFKVYLSRQLGAVNIGIYQVAISVFFVLATSTSSGIPLVVGKLTAKYKANHKQDLARDLEGKTVSAGIVVGLAITIVICLVFITGGKYIKQAFASPESFVCLMLLLPALIASTISNSIRGALWGRGMYKISSVLEIIEQGLRIGLCVLLFGIGTNKLMITAWTFSLACCLTAAICFIYYYLNKGRLKNPKGHIVPLLKDSIPITLSKISSSIVNMLISLCIPFLFVLQGTSQEEALSLLGISIGMAFPLLFTPITFVGSLAYTMLPDITALYAIKSSDTHKRIENGISISIVIACAFMPIFLALGSDIGILFFDNIESGKFITYSSWILIPLAIECIVSSMMNALEMEFKGLLSFIAGSGLMFGICFVFIGKFNLQVFSVAFGLSLTLSSIIDLILMKKRINLNFSFLPALIQCVLSIIPAFIVTHNLYSVLKTSFASLALQSTLHNTIFTILNIGIASLVSIGFYLLTLYLLDFAGVFGVLKNNKKISRKQEKHNKLENQEKIIATQ